MGRVRATLLGGRGAITLFYLLIDKLYNALSIIIKQKPVGFKNLPIPICGKLKKTLKVLIL